MNALTTDLQRVKRFVAGTRRLLNNRGYYPRLGVHRDAVLPALLSKAIRVSEAICRLVQAAFHEEAFGMTRTLLDLLFTVRFVANKRTDHRAQRFFDFYTKDIARLHDLVKKHYPGMAMPNHPWQARVLTLAQTYPDPHRWAGKGMSAKAMALEPDTTEKDDKGSPVTFEYLYDAVFSWTSHFIHPSIIALDSHVVRSGKDQFRVHVGADKGKREFAGLALFNVVCFLGQISFYCFKGMKEDQPRGYLDKTEMLLRSLKRNY